MPTNYETERTPEGEGPSLGLAAGHTDSDNGASEVSPADGIAAVADSRRGPGPHMDSLSALKSRGFSETVRGRYYAGLSGPGHFLPSAVLGIRKWLSARLALWRWERGYPGWNFVGLTWRQRRPAMGDVQDWEPDSSESLDPSVSGRTRAPVTLRHRRRTANRTDPSRLGSQQQRVPNNGFAARTRPSLSRRLPGQCAG